MTVNSGTDGVETFDVLVLGSGEAGKYLAWNLAIGGKRTALIERQYIGGSCPNIACLPSKNIIHSAKAAQLANEAEVYGLHRAEPGVSMEVVRRRKRDMVQELVQMHEDRFVQSGVELIRGEGRFAGPKTIAVHVEGQAPRSVAGEQVIISTGSRAAIDAIDGLAEVKPLTHVEALELDVVPEHLIILGAGYVGLEFAQAMRRFGSRVTVINRSARLLPREDPDVSEALASILTGEGIDFVTETRVSRVTGQSGEHVTVLADNKNGALQISGTHLLAATGRTPNTDGLDLEKAGIARTAKGFIEVNERLETSAPGVFAVGDCAGSPHFTHIAFDDFRVVRDVLAGKPRTIKGRLVPSCLFTDPELARVGLNESEAKRQCIRYRLLQLPMKAVLRTRTTGRTVGFLKALLSADDDTILGFIALGEAAGEMMAPVQLAMSAGLPFTALRNSIFAHPTYAEGLVYLFSGTPRAAGE